MSSVLIKTLQQKTFQIDIDHSETVRALKEKIEETQGSDFLADSLKLIYAGKILDDSQPLTKYKIKSEGFVVVMVSKSRPPPKSAAEEKTEAAATSGESSTTTQETSTPASTETTQPTTEAVATSESEGATRMESEATPTATPATTQGVDTTDNRGDEALQQAGSALVTGDQLDETVSNLMALGFERNEVVRALNAGFNNPDRAAEMLLSGTVPAEVPAPAESSAEAGTVEQPTRDTPSQQQSSGESSTPRGQQQGNPFEFLRERPQFQLLRQMIHQNPGTLPTLLQQLGESNPQLLQLISHNQQAFIDMINEPQPAGSAGPTPSAQGGSGGPTPPQGGLPQGMPPMPPGVGLPQGGMQDDPTMPPGAVSIQVTPEEKEAIERLKALGFTESEVIQAYIACDKNEELAANLLFSDTN